MVEFTPIEGQVAMYQFSFGVLGHLLVFNLSDFIARPTPWEIDPYRVDAVEL